MLTPATSPRTPDGRDQGEELVVNVRWDRSTHCRLLFIIWLMWVRPANTVSPHEHTHLQRPQDLFPSCCPPPSPHRGQVNWINGADLPSSCFPSDEGRYSYCGAFATGAFFWNTTPDQIQGLLWSPTRKYKFKRVVMRAIWQMCR